MNRAENLINQNKNLIERFIKLALNEDHIYDTRHSWFYSLISKEIIDKTRGYLTPDDIRSEIHLHIIQQLKNYKNSDFEFSNFLKKSIGWYIKDYILKIYRLYKNDRYSSIDQSFVDDTLSCDLGWIIKDQYLSSYQKYILYLYIEKCYTINHIAKLLYQERTTIRKELNKSKELFRRYYAQECTS